MSATLPDPAAATSTDELVDRLRLLKVWAGDPSYEMIKERVNTAWSTAGRPSEELARRSTVANCFQPGRRRFNTDLVLAVVEALHPDPGYVNQWRQALRVVGGETEAISQVRVQDTLPRDLDTFAGRSAELDRIDGAETVTIEGMAGVGKTQLAVHAAHRLARERVLFVNLRGFHPDPAQPPADPAAVLDGFLRLLGVPGHRIPHGLDARIALYRERLHGVPALIVLDNAASAEQARPLMPGVPGCVTIVTSRRKLAALNPSVRIVVGAFTTDEALTFLADAAPGIEIGQDPDAARRIARLSGHLPLALSLIAGHIRGKPGWTLTDHADRLDERRQRRRLDSEVELALDLSYQQLPEDQRRLFRLAALHPGQDLDVYAAAALTDTDLARAGAWLDDLAADHLLQPAGPGRLTFHDLVRAYAVTCAHDDERPPERRDALTRLFDHYVATTAATQDTLRPTEAFHRPAVAPSPTPAPDLSGPDDAIAWLETERSTLLAMAAHTPEYATRLAHVLARHLTSGYHADALIIHGHALAAARLAGDLAEQGHALRGLGIAQLSVGRLDQARTLLEQALARFEQADDPVRQGQVHNNLSTVAKQSGRYADALGHLRQALALHRRSGHRTGEASALNSIGVALEQMRRYPEAIEHQEQGLALGREIGNLNVVAYALNGLGETEVRSGRYDAARAHLSEALTLYRQQGNRTGEANVLDGLGTLHARLGEFGPAFGYYRRALAMLREIGDRHVETWVLNGMGEAALAAGQPHDAVAHHTAARTLAAEIGVRSQEAAASAGLANAYRQLGDLDLSRSSSETASRLYEELGLPS